MASFSVGKDYWQWRIHPSIFQHQDWKNRKENLEGDPEKTMEDEWCLILLSTDRGDPKLS